MNIENIIKKAEALFYAKNFDDAIGLCQKALRKKPKLIQVRQILAMCYQNQSNIKQAIVEFDVAIKHNPTNAYLLNNFGNLYLSILDFETAIKYLYKAIKLNPKLAAAYNNLGICLQQLGDIEQAKKNYKKAISLDGQDANTHQNLGTLCIELGEFEAANNFLVKSLELDRKQGNIYFHVFTLMLYQHRYQDALEVADMGILSENLSEMELCELLVGKATLFWLFNNLEEAHQAIVLSEMIYSDNSNYSNITNLITFHRFLKLLIKFKAENPDFYSLACNKTIYFISESHGFSPAGVTVTLDNQPHTIQSLFIRGAKVFHLTQGQKNKYKESLSKVFNELGPNNIIILGFGEIDCRNNEGIFKFCIKSGEHYKNVIKDMLNKYIEMIIVEAEKYDYRIILYGVPAPHPEAVNVLSTDEEKLLFKQIVEYFNIYLNELCVKNKLKLLNIYELTNQKGVSNLKYNIDEFHVHPKAILKLFDN